MSRAPIIPRRRSDRDRVMSAKIYAAFAADPNLHLRTDLGPFYRMGRDGIECRGMNTKQRAAYRAGAAIAKATGQAD